MSRLNCIFVTQNIKVLLQIFYVSTMKYQTLLLFQENLISLQKVADSLDKKLLKCTTQMKSTERQAAILLNVRFNVLQTFFSLFGTRKYEKLFPTFFDSFQDLRIKSEVLDRKIVEVDELKSELLGRNQGFRTLPERSSSKNVKSSPPLPGKPIVKQALHRKSTLRNSVQICQVCIPLYCASYQIESYNLAFFEKKRGF